MESLMFRGKQRILRKSEFVPSCCWEAVKVPGRKWRRR